MKTFNKDILKTFRHLRLNQFIAIFLNLLKTIVNLLLIYYLQNLLDNLIVRDLTKVNYSVKIIITIIIFYMILIFFQQYYLRKLFFLGEFSILKSLFKKIISKDLIFYNDKKSGELLSIITNDSKKISAWLSQGIVLVIVQSIVLLLTLGLLLKYSLVVTIILLTLILLSFYIVKKLTDKIAVLTKKDQKLQAEINQFILENFTGISDIKQLKKENYFVNYLEKILVNKKIKINKKVAKIFSFYIGTSSIVGIIIPIIAVLIATYYVVNGNLTIGSIMAVYTLSRMIDEPIRSISNFIGVRQIAIKIQDNIKNLYDNNENKNINTKLPKLNNFSVNIKSFKYSSDSKSILKNLSFSLKPGTITVLKGASGTGKTTLSNIILNNVSENSTLNGTILWNELDYFNNKEFDVFEKVLKSNQDTFIFTGTVKDNILLDDYYLEDKLDDILDIVELKEFINEKSLDYELMEQGKNISGGQRQRISLARILIRTPELLILDEPTSALNKEITEKIASNLNDFVKNNNISTLIISHNNIFDKYSSNIIKL